MPGVEKRAKDERKGDSGLIDLGVQAVERQPFVPAFVEVGCERVLEPVLALINGLSAIGLCSRRVAEWHLWLFELALREVLSLLIGRTLCWKRRLDLGSDDGDSEVRGGLGRLKNSSSVERLHCHSERKKRMT